MKHPRLELKLLPVLFDQHKVTCKGIGIIIHDELSEFSLYEFSSHCSVNHHVKSFNNPIPTPFKCKTLHSLIDFILEWIKITCGTVFLWQMSLVLFISTTLGCFDVVVIVEHLDWLSWKLFGLFCLLGIHYSV